MAAACPVAKEPATKMIMPAGTLKRVHVHQAIVKSNIKKNIDEPAVTVQWKGKSYKAKDVRINGSCAVMQRMFAPLSCGARIWIETRAEVEIE